MLGLNKNNTLRFSREISNHTFLDYEIIKTKWKPITIWPEVKFIYSSKHWMCHSQKMAVTNNLHVIHCCFPRARRSRTSTRTVWQKWKAKDRFVKARSEICFPKDPFVATQSNIRGAVVARCSWEKVASLGNFWNNNWWNLWISKYTGDPRRATVIFRKF